MKIGILIICVAGLLAAEISGAGTKPATKPKAAAKAPSSTPLPVAAQEKSLAMLWQVAKQLEYYVQTKDLTAIHNEDVILGAASTELFAQADSITAKHSEKFKANLTTFCQLVSKLHIAADLNQQPQSEAALAKVLEAFEKVKNFFRKSVVRDARVFLETFTCPMHRDVIGKRTDFCAKCGMPLDQMCRVLPADPSFPVAGQETVQARVTTPELLEVGKPVAAILHLQRPDGDPVLVSDLIETHTKKIHLFIIDSSLTDYHHEHPEPTRNPGEYSFGFTPTKPGGYRVWADLRPYPLGLQEYAMTDIPGKGTGEALTDRSVNLKSTVDGLHFELVIAQERIQVGRPAVARLRITTETGEGVTNLEPVMAAFAHLVGFNQDYRTVLHMHPKGAPVLDPNARGGPELEFQIYALRPGYYRLFAQVQINGENRFAPFGIEISR